MGRSEYPSENESGVIGYRTDDIKGAEYVVAWIEQGLHDPPEIRIYGNPKGLMHLAQILIRVASINRASDPITPAGEGYHCHICTGLNSERRFSLPELKIGRVDSYEAPDKLMWASFPDLVPEWSPEAITDPSDLPPITVEPADGGEPPDEPPFRAGAGG